MDFSVLLILLLEIAIPLYSISSKAEEDQIVCFYSIPV